MNNIQNFDIRIEEPCLENYADPPEDPLGELSNFSMAIRRFCFECNYQVSIQIGDVKKNVFFDPDICVLLENNIPEKILALSQGKEIEIIFMESCNLIINLKPTDNIINCTLQDFGYSSKQQKFVLDKNQVLEVFINFLNKVMEKAVVGSYITSLERDKFLMPIRKQAIAQ